MHDLAFVQKNGTRKLLWDFDIETDNLILDKKPDLIIINKKKNLQTCGPLNKTERKWNEV